MTRSWNVLGIVGLCAVACGQDGPVPTSAEASTVVRQWIETQPAETCAEGTLTLRPERFVLQQAFWLDGAAQVVAVMTGESTGVCPGAGPWAKAVHARLVAGPTGWVLVEPLTLTGLPASVITELDAADERTGPGGHDE